MTVYTDRVGCDEIHLLCLEGREDFSRKINRPGGTS